MNGKILITINPTNLEPLNKGGRNNVPVMYMRSVLF